MRDELYKHSDEFYDPEEPRPIIAAATAMVSRLRVGDPDLPELDDMGIDSRDHFIIAARHAVRAFYREAERPR